MKHETKNKIIIIQLIIIVGIIIYIIISGVIQGRKNLDYKTEIDRLETEIDGAREANTRLDNINRGLEENKRELENIIARNGEEIQRLENITNKLRENNQSSVELIDEIEKLFTEIMDN